MKKYYLHIIVVIGYFIFVAGSCGVPEISGCTDSRACNYNIEATIDNGNCILSEENLDCNGNCIMQTDDGCKCAVLYDECGFCGGDNSSCTNCNGEINGDSSILDMCEVCDNDLSNDCVQDCVGLWGGTAVDDECGVCDGDDTTCLDCANVPNGDAYTDGCGYCVGGSTELVECPKDCNGVANGNSFTDNCGECVAAADTSCVQGCDGNWSNDDSELTIDECGVCGGNNSTCLDCTGVVNGDSFIDNCGECVPENDTTCVQGCDGFWVNDGFETLIDNCSICGGINSPNTGNCDCSGLPSPDDISWKIQILTSLLPYNNPALDIVDDEENYLGASPNATDQFDGIEIDEIDVIPPIDYNWVNFYFYHDDWTNATASPCVDFCTKFKEDIRSNNHSEYTDGNTKIWNGYIEYSAYGMATLKLASTSNLTGVDISISVNTGEFIPISINESIDIQIYPNEIDPIEINIQISNLCY